MSAGHRRPSRKVKKTLSEQLAKKSFRGGVSSDDQDDDCGQRMDVYSPAEAERAFSRSLSEGGNLRCQANLALDTMTEDRPVASTCTTEAFAASDQCVDNISDNKLDDDEALFEDIMAAVGNVNELLDTDSVMFGGSRASGFSQQVNINRLCRQYSFPLQGRRAGGDEAEAHPTHHRLSRSFGDYIASDFMAARNSPSSNTLNGDDEFGEVSSLQLSSGDALSRQQSWVPEPLDLLRPEQCRVTIL